MCRPGDRSRRWPPAPDRSTRSADPTPVCSSHLRPAAQEPLRFGRYRAAWPSSLSARSVESIAPTPQASPPAMPASSQWYMQAEASRNIPLGKTGFGHMRRPPNPYLKWAFRPAFRSAAEGIEAANVVVRHRHHPAGKMKYVWQICGQVWQRTGHAMPSAPSPTASSRLPSAYSQDADPAGRLLSGRTPTSRREGLPNLHPFEIREMIAWHLWHLLNLPMPLCRRTPSRYSSGRCGRPEVPRSSRGEARFEPRTEGDTA